MLKYLKMLIGYRMNHSFLAHPWTKDSQKRTPVGNREIQRFNWCLRHHCYGPGLALTCFVKSAGKASDQTLSFVHTSYQSTQWLQPSISGATRVLRNSAANARGSFRLQSSSLTGIIAWDTERDASTACVPVATNVNVPYVTEFFNGLP